MPKTKKTAPLSTRTTDARATLDARVLAVLQAATTPVACSDIADKVGASLLQVRTAIRRLGEQVTKSGNTRARTYRIAQAAA